MSKQDISRRDFLKRFGLGIGTAGLAMAGCDTASKQAAAQADTDAAGGMTYRTNPRTGEQVSILGYGCMRWPTTKDADGKDVLDQEMINRLVDTAIERGVNYFDTSPVYCEGQSEHVTGIALARHPRSSYYIATKMSNFAPQTRSRQASIDIYHNSLRELQTDYIDYMLLHAIGGGDGLGEFRERFIDNGVLDYLMAEREAGRIKNLGFSYHGDIAVFDWALAHHDEYHWDFVQIQLNYLDWKHAHELNPSNTNAEYLYGELEKRGIPAVIMEPLLGGRLANVPDHIAARLKQREPERSVASWAFRYAGTHPGVLTVLSGMTYMEHLEDNLRSYSPLVPLTDEEMQFLYATADLMVQYPTIGCTGCQYCMPCPYGIDIPAIFKHYNKCVNHGYIANAQDENYAKARRAFLVGYDRSVPRLRQANHCIGCNQCTSHCPQRIDIPAQMQRIDRYVESLKQQA